MAHPYSFLQIITLLMTLFRLLFPTFWHWDLFSTFNKSLEEGSVHFQASCVRKAKGRCKNWRHIFHKRDSKTRCRHREG